MKKGLNRFISILLTLIFAVGLMPLMSIPVAAAKAKYVALATANGDTVEWSSKVGSNDGYWEITAENDNYDICICSGVTDHEAGSYAWSDLQGDLCGLTVKSTDTTVTFTSCSSPCIVTVFGDAVNVSGVFVGDDSWYYVVDITYGTFPAVSFAKATSVDDIEADNIGECIYSQAKAWILSNWDDVTNTDASYIDVVYSDGTDLYAVYFAPDATQEEFESKSASKVQIDELKGYYNNDGEDVWLCSGVAAPAAITEWHIGDPINLGGKYYINDDQGAPPSYGFDRDVIVSEPVYETMYNQWIFENVIAYNASEAFALYISLPTGKTASDVPTGFKVKSGDGTEASPYEFELVYAEKFVAEFSTDNPFAGFVIDSSETFACDEQGTGKLDDLIKIALGSELMGSGVSANIAPTVTGGNGAVVAGLNNGYQYLTISERFDGNVTVSGKYYLGTEENDYSFTIACSDFVPVESVSISPDTAQTINVNGTVAITPTVTPNEAFTNVVIPSVGGTNSSAVALYLDANCNYLLPQGMPVAAGAAFYVKGVSAGTATVTITSPEDDQFTASVTVTVTAATAYAGYVPTANDDADALAAKVVKFNGYDWYLIEDNSTAADAGTVTLLAKDMSFGTSAFDENYMTIRYVNSTVRAALLNLTADGGSFAAVSGAITATDLTDIELTGEKLWLLSADQVDNLPTAVKTLNSNWWIRTPGTNGPTGTKAKCVDTTGSIGESYVDNSLGVRPALQLDLSNVEFDSESNTFTSTAPVEYPLWVGGVQVTSANAMDTTAHPTWSYAADTHTLTLNGYTNSGTARADIQSGVNNAAIYYDDNMSSPNPLTIQLAEGTTNSLTMTGDRVYGIYVFGSALTITGNGTLNVQSDEMAINDAWGVAITGGTVNAASSAYYGIGSVTIGADISSVTITGQLGAIYGGSNEDQALINAVAGTGWTDTAGTTGEADIAISTTGQNVSSYKKVQFPAVEPAPLPEGLWVGETEVTDTVTSGDGWSYDASTNTLTLSEYYYSDYGHKFSKTMNSGLYYKGETPLNIVLEGRNWISPYDKWESGSYDYRSVGIYAEGGVKFSGTGYLSVSGSLGGIIGDATVDGGELHISADSHNQDGHAGVTNLTVNGGKVTVNGGDTLSGGCVGGYAVETLTVNGGFVYVYGGNAYNDSSAVPQSAVKTLTVNGGVLYAKSGSSNYGSYSIPAVTATADGGSITVGKDVKVYGDEIESSYDYDMPTTETEKISGDYARNSYMIFEGPSAKVTVPYKDHEWKSGALVTTDKEMTCNTVTFAMGTEWSGNYYADHNVTLGSEKEPVTITLTGNTNIVLSDTATLYVYGTVNCGDYTLNVYGNEQGGGYSKAMYETGRFTINNTSETALSLGGDTLNVHGGTVTVQCSGKYDDTPVVLEVENLSVYAGSLEVTAKGEKGLSALACDNTNVYGGSLYVQGGDGDGDVDGGAGFFGTLTVYGGYVNAYGGSVYGAGTGNGGSGMSGDVTVYGGQISVSGGYSGGGYGGVGFAGTLTVYGGIFDADGGYNSNDDRNYAISGTVTLGEGVGYFEGYNGDLFAEGPVEEMESGTAGYSQIKGGVKYVYVDQTTGEVTTAYAYDAESKINSWLWSKWYIVEKDTTISDAAYFDTDEVNIIIADGVTLTFEKGIAVPEGKTLKIYAQSLDESTMGKLIATGANGAAGIGATSTNAGGNVYVYSGNVEATGDTGAAGIDGTVYIYGGSVTAIGGEGSVGINGDLTLGEGIMLYGDDDVNPPTTVIEEESGNYHRTRYMIAAKEAEEEPSVQTVTVTAHCLSKIYGYDDPELTYTVEGLPAGVALTGSLERAEGEDVGYYAITIGTLSAGDKYTLTFIGGTLEITARNVDVKADAASKTYGDADPELTYTVEGLVWGDALTGALARTEGETAGTYEITQGTLSAGNNYVINFTGSTLTIGKKTVTVKADAKTKTCGDTDPELTYTVEGLVGTDTLTGSLERVSGEDAGTYDITIGTLSAGDNYVINFTGSTLTINTAEIKTVKVTANAVTKTYGEKDPELTYTAEGLAEGDTLTGTLERAEGENAGSYEITLGTLTAGDKYTIEFTGSTLTIEKKTVKVTANDVTKTYGENDPELTYTVEGLVGNDALTGSLERVSGEDAGTYDITIGTLSAGDNYVLDFTGATLTINTTEIKTVKVTAAAATKTYGYADPQFTYTVEGLAAGDKLTGSLDREEGEDAGIYAITLGTLTAGDNYTIEFVGSTLTIEKKTVTVTADAKTKTGGENDPELTYTVEGLVGNDALTGSLERAAGEDAGTYEITIGTLSAGDNYEINFIGSTLTINASEIKTVKVTANAVTKTYGDKDPELTYTAEGLAEGDTLTGSLERAAGEDAGTYEITLGTLTAGDKYTIEFTGSTLTIEKKAVAVKADAKTKTYGDRDPEFTYSAEGLVGNDTLTGSLERAAGENAGTYEITLGTLTAGDNYTLTFTGSALTVEKKAVTVKADAKTKTYGDNDPELTCTVEGLVGNDTLTGSLERTAGENAGKYEITQGTLSANDNYTLTFTGAELTVKAKRINVTADDQKKAVGTSDPELTYIVEGLVGNDTLTGSLEREAGENEGTYAITQGTLAAGGNYVINFTGADFTIYENRVETDVNVSEGVPEMKIENIDEEAASSLLTEEEKEALDNGEEVKIYLEVIAVDEEIVPEEDKTEIEKEAQKSGMTVGMYLDMSLLKKVGRNDAVAIHDTDGNMVKVTVTVPEELRNTNPNIKRTFYVVRVHEGKTEILGESTGDTVSFETDKFSTYSLTYKDSDNTVAGSLAWLWIVIAIAAAATVCAVWFFFVKKKA